MAAAATAEVVMARAAAAAREGAAKVGGGVVELASLSVGGWRASLTPKALLEVYKHDGYSPSRSSIIRSLVPTGSLFLYTQHAPRGWQRGAPRLWY